MAPMKFTVALLISLIALPAVAGGSKDDFVHVRSSTDAIEQPLTEPDAVDPVERFVESNIAETLYHELGHALIDKLDLPVFGPEEFAADMFALVMINELHTEADVLQIAYDVAAAYQAGAVKERSASATDMWDLHGTDAQRYYNVACMIYGADPDNRAEVIRKLDLPDARAETCAEEYALTYHAWKGVLEQVATNAPGQSLKVDWVLNAESPLTRFVNKEVDQLNQIMTLPEDVAVSVIPCDEPNAFYDPFESEIIICTELGDDLARLAP